MRRLFFILFLLLTFITGFISVADAATGDVYVSYIDKKKQRFMITSSPSDIKRMTLDKEPGGDRLVITYFDDTHQVFILSQPLHKVSRITFEGSNLPEAARDLEPEPTADTQGYFNPGHIWRVTEHCSGVTWKGVWSRQGTSLTFDAYWESNRGDKLRSEVEIVDVSNGRIKLFRSDKGGTYEGTLSADMKRVINGWAPWYGQHCQPWSAVIE